MSYQSEVLETAGLVSLWPLHEAAGQALDVKDSNPATANGTIARASASILPNGEKKSADLNGTTGYYSILDAANLDIGDVCSLECWVVLDGLGATQTIIDLGTNSAVLRVEVGNKFSIIQAGVAVIVESTNTLESGRAYHLVATKSGATSKLYCNGVDVTGTVTNKTLANNAIEKTIGRRAAASSEFFNGKLQHAAVYNVAISATTVREHYEAAIPATTAPIAPHQTKWSFILTNLEGTPIGEIHNAGARALSMPMNGIATATCTVRPDNDLIHDLYHDDTLLQVWEDNELRFWGPVTSVDLGGLPGQPSVNVGAADPGWRLSKRLGGKSSTGKAFTTTDKVTIAKTLIEEANSSNDTGIRYETTLSGVNASYTAGPYKPVIQCINDIASSLDGFDWRITPVHGEASPIIGKFRAEEIMGTEKPNVVFEAGTGKKNIKSFGFMRDLNNLVNVAYHLSTEVFGTNVKAEDATSIAHRGRFEELTDPNNLESTALREEWVKSVVEVRKNPRNIVSMTLGNDDDPNTPDFWDDFRLGDIVTARAKLDDGSILFNGLVRIWKINVDIDSNGHGTVTPILVDEGGLSS